MEIRNGSPRTVTIDLSISIKLVAWVDGDLRTDHLIHCLRRNLLAHLLGPLLRPRSELVDGREDDHCDLKGAVAGRSRWVLVISDQKMFVCGERRSRSFTLRKSTKGRSFRLRALR